MYILLHEMYRLNVTKLSVILTLCAYHYKKIELIKLNCMCARRSEFRIQIGLSNHKEKVSSSRLMPNITLIDC